MIIISAFFHFLSSVLLFNAVCRWIKSTILHAISLHWHAIWNSPFLRERGKSFRRRFFSLSLTLSPPPIEKINIFKSSGILLFNFSSSLSIISSIHFRFSSFSIANSTRLFKIKYLLYTLIFAFFNTLFSRDGVIYCC